jgi:hypothetical protein
MNRRTTFRVITEGRHCVARFVRKTIDKLGAAWRLAAFCHRHVPFWNTGYLPLVRRAADICHKHGFTPSEAFRLGLFRPGISPEDVSNYISRKRLTRLQKSLNPRECEPLLKDKSVFYEHCRAKLIPIPRQYATFSRGRAWTSDGPVPRDRNEWLRYFSEQLPGEFVIKPVCGAYGRRVAILARQGDVFIDTDKRRFAAGELYDFMAAGNDEFIIQERLFNHPDIVRLSSSQYLQTVRFVTFIDHCGQCRILHAHFKTIAGGEIVDTFMDGLKGNLEAAVSLSDGRLSDANQVTGTTAGIAVLQHHPRTGIAFEDFKLPMWAQACDLVNRTAPQFMPVRTVGWDVALTPDGPCIVEGNIWWDAPNQHHCASAIAGVLSDAAALV